MNKYLFETGELGVSDKGIHLLRNRYNYETIDFSMVEDIRIIQGKQIRNSLLILVLGVILLAFGIFTGIKIPYEFFFLDRYHHFYVEEFAIPIIPLILGPYSIYISLKKGYVLLLTAAGKTKRFPIEELNEKSQIPSFITFLQVHTNTAFKMI